VRTLAILKVKRIMTGWLTADELKGSSFRRIGHGCKISRGAEFIGAENISIGDNVRIDTGALLLAGAEGSSIEIADHVHIASRAILLGSGGIKLGKFTTIGFVSKLISASDSFSGEYMVGPCYEPEFVSVTKAPIVLEDHAIVTTDCTVLPGSVMREGAVLGAMALLKGEAVAWHIYAGIPARPRHERVRRAQQLGRLWEERWKGSGS
jgi:acetyltransferase-like isoleucine patch superfamily enzyme